MELHNLDNINNIIKRNTYMTLGSIFIVCVAFAFIINKQSNQIAELQQNVLVIDTKGNAYEAQAVQASYTRIYEYENHVKTFIQLWYAFDENNYEENINTALNLIGENGKELLNQYNDLGMLNILRQKNIHYNAKVDDINIDMNTLPISGTATVTQTGYRAKGSVSRTLNITFTLYDVARCKENVHGAKIDKWEISQIKNGNEDEN